MPARVSKPDVEALAEQGRIVLNIPRPLLAKVEQDSKRTGSTKSRFCVRILAQYYEFEMLPFDITEEASPQRMCELMDTWLAPHPHGIEMWVAIRELCLKAPSIKGYRTWLNERSSYRESGGRKSGNRVLCEAVIYLHSKLGNKQVTKTQAIAAAREAYLKFEPQVTK